MVALADEERLVEKLGRWSWAGEEARLEGKLQRLVQ